MFEVNVLGPFLGTRAVTPVMRKAGAVVYLAANDARFITGAVLNIDGGYLAGHARPPAAGTARGTRPTRKQKVVL